MMGARPIRVLHTIDGLGGGGSERWVWELVRLSDPTRVVHRVVPIHFDLGRFVYAERLRAAGAMRSARGAASGPGREFPGPSQHTDVRRLPRSPLPGCPAVVRRGLVRLWHYSAVFPAAAMRSVNESIRFRPDVIHGHTFHGFVAGLWLSALFRRPLVHSVPSFFKHVIESGYGWLPGVYARYHRRVDRFLTNYPSELVGIGVAAEKIVVFRGMADVDAVARLDRAVHRRAVRRQLGIPDQSLIGLTVGRLSPEKGLEYGLRALPRILDRCRNLHWVILGDGSLRPELDRLAASLGIADHVHLAGFVDDPLPWYAAADLYLRTNVLEGDNLSSVQAMAAALPVAGFDTGSEAELVREVGHGILAAPRDAESFAAAATRLVDDAAERRRLGERGAAYAAAQFDNGRVVDRCEAMYEDVHQRGTVVG